MLKIEPNTCSRLEELDLVHDISGGVPPRILVEVEDPVLEVFGWRFLLLPVYHLYGYYFGVQKRVLSVQRREQYVSVSEY